MPSVLMYNRDAIARLVPWEDLVSSPASTFQATHLPDIGKQVRSMLMKGMDRSCDQLLELFRYSMPYIKHNRLTFFPFETVRLKTLQAVLRIQLATCLGLYSDSSKKPVWRVRVRLVAMFCNILANGTAMDMYIFCNSHIALMRLSLMEYYIYFVTTNMPVEARLQHKLFGSETNVPAVFRQMCTIFDAFRQAQFQGEDLDWPNIHQRSQSAVEKCNRSCKGVTKSSAQESRPTTFDITSTLLAMDVPIFANPNYVNSALGIKDLHRAREVHSSISTHMLPFNVVYRQSQAILPRMRTDTFSTTNNCFMYICLPCAQRVPDKNLRAGPAGVVCGNCQSSSCILKINMVGRIICVMERKFYLCPFCVHVHEWKSSGHELFMCERQGIPVRAKKGCVICTHTNSSNVESVLDSHLGIMQTVVLCNRHTPYENQMRYVHDLESLVVCIQNKFRKKT